MGRSCRLTFGSSVSWLRKSSLQSQAMPVWRANNQEEKNGSETMTSNTLEGQAALVTGAGRGIGRAMAIALAARGASVALTARSEEQLNETQAAIRELGGDSAVIPADMTDPDSITAMVRAVEGRFGAIDLLVNNAASGGQLGPTWESDPAEWWRCFEVNVRGPFLGARQVLPGMVSRKRGRIVNVASGAGVRAIPYFNPYAITKTTIMRFSEALAMECQTHGISVFAMDPGLVRTELVNEALRQPESDQWIPWFREMVESERTVPPEHAANLVVRFATGELDALNGRYISVYHDIGRMVRESAKIAEDGLYILRVNGLPETEEKGG
jgi:NAD(P)-dependent dehydrogenase (short-subunit alcohol dehydrogenase family)